MTNQEWQEEGVVLFGSDQMQWRFVCPVCGFAQSVQDYKDAGAPEGAVAFSCIGRWRDGARDAFTGKGDVRLAHPVVTGPCNYSGGGLLRLNPVDVDGRKVFAFAQNSKAQNSEAQKVSLR